MKYVSTALATILLSAGLAAAAEDVVVVYDASGSMWGQIDGVSKVEIAREVMEELVTGWDENTNLGLVVYGHRRQGDCGDIETLVEPGPIDRDAFITTINGIRPLGKTPISASVQHAADLLSYRDNPATVVLISDGVETCNADPCALSEELAKQGVKFTTHVVGFDLEDEAHASLACIAENTGGIFVPANNAAELHNALAEVQDVMREASETAPEVEPEPEPEPEAAATPAPEVTLLAPEQVEIGTDFRFTWSNTLDARDFITIVPAGADEGSFESYVRTGSNDSGELTAPGDAGLYELRYVLNEGRRTLASIPVEVIEAQVVLDGPEQVTTGSTFRFTWSNTLNGRDFITIVPAGADEGSFESYIRTGSNDSGELTAPGDAGLYELRYVLNEGRRTLGSIPVEVIEAQVVLDGPEQVTTGSTFRFTWSNTLNARDFITIVPAGADEGSFESYVRTGSNDSGELTAPGDAGLYELRYVLNEGRRTLASIPVEVIEAQVVLDGPEQVTTGSTFRFTWSNTLNARDFITIVPAGADEGSFESYVRTGSNDSGELTAPGDAGLYELRYVLNEGRRTLASIPVEIVDAEMGISAPEIIRAGNDIDISWSATINDRDFITIVPAGADAGTIDNYNRAGSGTSTRMKAPSETGLYEIRYVLNEGRRVLASTSLEVVDADAPLDDGAGMSVPESAAPGETITITWTGGGGGDERITVARRSQPDFSWMAAVPAGDGQTVEITMPEEAGFYEIRFLDLSGPKVLGRSVVEVK